MWKPTRFFMKHTGEHTSPSSLAFQKWLLLSYSLILIFVLAVGVFLYQLSYKEVKSGIDAQDNTMLAAAVRRMDANISNISNAARQLSGSSDFTTLADFPTSDPYQFNYLAYQTQTALKDSAILRQLTASDTFIYLKQTGYIISDTEFIPFGSYAKYRLFCTEDMAEKIRETLNSEEHRSSYQQAKDARSITTAERYILSYTDFIHSSDIYYYPDIMAAQLTSAISTGSREQVTEIFRLITKENMVNRSLPHSQHRQLLTDVHSTLFKKRYSLSLSEGKTFEEGSSGKEKLDYIDRQLSEELNLKTLEQIALELCGFCVQEGSSNELIAKIRTYITENYHDPSLCLTKISDEFNISENYFSSLFKKETGENFSIYLEKLRMAKAKELVENSDTGLSNLYQYLGYNNAASFRRVFKKTYGISPKEMREQHHGS